MSINSQINQEISFLFNGEKEDYPGDYLECFDTDDFVKKIQGSTDKNFIMREFAFMLKKSEDNIFEFYKNIIDTGVHSPEKCCGNCNNGPFIPTDSCALSAPEYGEQYDCPITDKSRCGVTRVCASWLPMEEEIIMLV